jgi:hypothetical protein
LGLGATRRLDFTPVGGGNVDVDQLQGGELLQGASWSAWGQRAQAPRQRCVQAIGEEGNEDVRFDARFELMEDGAYGEIPLEVPESLFDAPELKVIAPERSGIVIDQIGAQEIAPLAPARLAQLVAIEAEAEGRLPGIDVDRDEAPSGVGPLARRRVSSRAPGGTASSSGAARASPRAI